MVLRAGNIVQDLLTRQVWVGERLRRAIRQRVHSCRAVSASPRASDEQRAGSKSRLGLRL